MQKQDAAFADGSKMALLQKFMYTWMTFIFTG